MAKASQARPTTGSSTGFWRGLMFGLGLAAAAAVAVGIAVPPVRYLNPAVTPDAALAPIAPPTPAPVAPWPRTAPLSLRSAPIAGPPPQEPSLAAVAIGPAATPRVHDGGASGGPSLMPMGN